jgi:serine/threonine protein kinase
MAEKIQYKIAPGFEALDNWVKNLPGYFAANGRTIFKDRNEVKIFEVNGLELNVKAFRLPNLVNRYAYVYLRGSKAARSFRNALHLMDAGASTPEPVAYLECLSEGKLRDSYFVSINYPHDFTLREVITNQVPDKETILRQWVYFNWYYLHQQGIYHLDNSPGNTLIRKNGKKYEFAVVDLNRMKFIPVDFEKGIQNFRQLDADEESIQVIAREYASLCKFPESRAFELLTKYDEKNKAYFRRKENLKALKQRIKFKG